MRIPWVLGGGLVAGVLSTAVLVAGPGIVTAGADCSGPQVFVSPATAAPGQLVTVAGVGFGDSCNDTGGPGPVLGQPLQEIELWIELDDERKQAAVVDAGPGYDFAVQVVVPPSLGTGAGTITASTGGSWSGPTAAALVVEGAPLRDDDPGVYDAGRFAAPTEGRVARAQVWAWALLGAVAGVVVALAGVVLVSRRRAR